MVALVALPNCGVPRDGKARAIAENDPDGLVQGSPPPTTLSTPTGQVINLYFVGTDELAKAPRPAAAPADPATVIGMLLGGPTPKEKDSGLVSSIPPDTQLLGEPVLSADGVLTLDLSSELNGITGASLKEAYAQIVYTATDLPKVASVAFLTEGKPIAVPTDEGNLDVVGRPDYATLTPAAS